MTALPLPRFVLDTPWRRLATAFFDAPHSGRILFRAQVNAEPVEAYLAAQPGRRLDAFYVVAAAAARTIAHDVPALNGYLRRGRVHARAGTTVSVTSAVPGSDGLIAIPLRQADRLPASALAPLLRRTLLETRTRLRRTGRLPEYALARVPWPLRRAAFRAVRGLAGLGVPMARYDMAPESFGALVITNMEPLVRGYPEDDSVYDIGFAPLFPAARNASFLAVFPPRDLPAAVGGAAVVQRRFTLCATFDHRLVDGLDAGRFFQGVTRRLLDPAALDRPADAP